MNTDGSGLTRLTNDPAGDWVWDWSPNGRRIGFQSSRNGNNDIYTINSDGSNLIRLTDDPKWDGALAWSPDGKRIAFSSWRDGGGFYVMNTDGSEVTPLTDLAPGLPPVWSPDGQRIAILSGPVDNSEIYVINADGSDMQNLRDLQIPASSPASVEVDPLRLNPLRLTASSSNSTGGMPDLKIQDNLFIRGAGSDNFDELTMVLDSEGDWVLASSPAEVVLPIPSGWTTVEEGSLSIFFSEDGNLDQPSIQMWVTAPCICNVAEAMASFEEWASGKPNITIVKKGIIDDYKAYAFQSLDLGTGSKAYSLDVFFQNSNGWLYYLEATTAQEDWNDYYPLIRAMVAHLAGLDNTPIGVALPEEILVE